MFYFLKLIKTGFYKLINFLFGKTKIFIIILGWFLIITGAMFLARPEKARNKLISQSFGILKWPLFFLTLYVAMLFISLSSKVPGIASMLLIVAGIFIIIRAFIFLRKKALRKLTEQFAKVPIRMLKVFAGIQILVGLFMLFLQKRIW